ncbi:unnamed protein product [Euphydryas editha]|uniref:Uncharacterized protein n=1 Tax=Euphydryas editha TaxID=104508 RepID=A0AAU9TYF2_EUPED|nr:unnamed protein product [Euphydryas editha]
MEYQNINNTLINAETVTSTYADIFFKDNRSLTDILEKNGKNKEEIVENGTKEEWISPSDLLINKIKLHPPFTSKITRGKTHEGILAIGNEVLEKQRAIFLKSLTKLLHDNDDSWEYILTHEKEKVIKKVKSIFQNIFKNKSDIMKREISLFYESSLQELENHLNSEMQILLQTAYANIISDLNRQIQQKMLQEKQKLEINLKQKFIVEVGKVRKYYSLLLHNERYRINKLVNQAMQERNDSLGAFYRQIEAERITSTMYLLSSERKKCIVQKLVQQNLQTDEIINKKQEIEEKSKLIEGFKQKYVGISDINREWEQKIKKILQLFLKFVSFSLKMLPEQTTFLLDFEKMLVLQLNEIQKNPAACTSILINADQETNIFKFEEPKTEVLVCEKDPFVLIGDLSDPIPKVYGSRETLPSDVDLPYFRVERQYVYAKCHGYESIKKYLESQKCKCHIPRELSLSKTSNIEIYTSSDAEVISKTSSESIRNDFESLLLDDYRRFVDCPVRKCQNWIKKYSFPNLASYLDYSEENFRRVTAILGNIPQTETLPNLINPKDIARSELPFSATKELIHNVGTQYSSQEDLSLMQMTCPCVENILEQGTEFKFKYTSNNKLENILSKRNKSLERLMKENPNLLKIFTDERLDYKL